MRFSSSADLQLGVESSNDEQGGGVDEVLGAPSTIKERVHRYSLTKLRAMSRDDLDHATVTKFARQVERDLCIDLIPDERTLVRALFLDYSVPELSYVERRRRGSSSALSSKQKKSRRRKSLIASARTYTSPKAIISGRRRSVPSSAAYRAAVEEFGIDRDGGGGGLSATAAAPRA